MRFFPLWICACLLTAEAAHAQWTMQDSHTDASLRGIDSVGNGIAWAAGTNGTVLRTEDGGKLWQTCAVPPGAEALDFRGVQAFDAKTAIVMSSGKGDLSRLYKTTDGCQTWQLVLKNPDLEGFWDALVFASRDAGELVGDPVRGRFFVSSYLGPIQFRETSDGSAPKAVSGEAVFAASNSAVLSFGRLDYMVGTGGANSRVIFFKETPDQPGSDSLHFEERSANVPVGNQRQSSGIFALAYSDRKTIVAVGGDYLKPDSIQATAASSKDGGYHWTASVLLPHGYRSAVAYDAATKTWVTVGPNGTDISTDDGRNWRTLKPGPGEPADADQHWNALSLPFVVGPKGRIGVLRGDALTSAASK